MLDLTRETCLALPTMKTTPPVITSLLAHIASECRAVDREAAYRAFLDDAYPQIEVAGLTFSPSDVIENLDETAFRCGVNDYADGQDWTEVDGETYEDREIEAARESFADIKREEITAKETEAEQLSQEIGDDESTPSQSVQMAELRAEIATLETELAEIEGYSF